MSCYNGDNGSTPPATLESETVVINHKKVS